MAFKVDNQTISDLKIFGSKTGNDIFSIYNRTKTRGGGKILKDMFLYPRSRKEEIENRVNIIKYFKKNKIKFPFSGSLFDTIEEYLSKTDPRTRLTAHADDLKRKFNHAIGSDFEYQLINTGVESTLEFLSVLKRFVSELAENSSSTEINKDIQCIKEVLDIPDLAFLNKNEKLSKLSYAKTVEYDQILRFTIAKDITKLLFYTYDLDVYCAVAKVAQENNFAFAEINDGGSNHIEIKGVYHPLVENAIPNDITIDENSNMIFLTGANMAGKSTFMKTFSIAIYIAHMGFPLPAKEMRFRIQNGMFTTINLADNLSMGFSHFYAEVSRVKKVADNVNRNDHLIVVFDELFRGTNVKDAHEATVAVMDAFANKKGCTFIISTHIIEAGEDLKKLKDNIKFLYLPTVMNGQVPKYTYKVKEGITSDRHGMIIIQNEKILDILNNN
ncbi:MutS-related protein [Marinifilum sp. RC60d5]|uniref:MutS-related protein n=1 Tax=Marinifilum sp. RC60d5 TaxID=3458414 RepID=UPI0040375D51